MEQVIETITANPNQIRFDLEEGLIRFCIMLEDGLNAMCWHAPPEFTMYILTNLNGA